MRKTSILNIPQYVYVFRLSIYKVYKAKKKEKFKNSYLNETQVSSYNLLNITYSKQIFNNSEIYLGVNNLLDVNYFDNIRINAFGKRYYEPAPKRNIHFGLNLSF